MAGVKRPWPRDSEEYNHLPAKRAYRESPYQEDFHQRSPDTLYSGLSPCPFNTGGSTSPYPSNTEFDADISVESLVWGNEASDQIQSSAALKKQYNTYCYGPTGDSIITDSTPYEFRSQTPGEETTSGESLSLICIAGNSFGGKTEAEVLCFGMICGARVSLFDKPKTDNLAYSFSPEAVIRYSIRHEQNCFFLLSPTGTEVGILDLRTTKVLCDICDLDSIRFEAFISCDQETESTQQSEKSKDSCGNPVTINIYGSRTVLNVVGKTLSRAKIYLQQPDNLAECVVYENPHYFGTTGQAIPVIKRSTEIIQPPEDLNNMITTVLDSLGTLDTMNLPELPDDARIKTGLLRHQSEGVSFIMRQEDSFEAGGQSLWKFDNCNGQPFYRHKITGQRKGFFEKTCRGGILADDMGLGKTFTMLSSIVHSLDRAHMYAHSPTGLVEHRLVSGRIATKATLIIVPLSLLDGWMEEIEKHIVKGSINVYKYHGKTREPNPTKLKDFDIILTTYATVTYDHSTSTSPLEKLSFFRIVLDEAHIIRSRSTKQFSAVSCLLSEQRWCLTGTPVQNKLEDMESLMIFLRLSPFNDRSVFRKFIVDPLKTGDTKGLENLRSLLGSICIRRMQTILTTLPESTEKLRILELSPEERKRYKTITEYSNNAIQAVICDGNSKNVYHKILQAILLLRLLCNHGTYDVGSSASCTPVLSSGNGVNQWGDESTPELLQEVGEATCAYCYCPTDSLDSVESSNPGFLTICSHFLCPDCLPRYESCLKRLPGKKVKFECPLCQSHLGPKYLVRTQRKRDSKSASSPRSIPDFSTLQSGSTSTKITALLRNLEQNGEEKSVVFSYWTKTLDLVENILAYRGIQCVRLDGSLSATARKKVLDIFHSVPAVKVLLMTTGTGAVGLNLTVASRVHILEPQWNPMVESQAVCRIRRLGQTRPVSIFRYIIRDSIEEAVQMRQMKKLQLAELTCDTGHKEQEGNMMNLLLDLRTLL